MGRLWFVIGGVGMVLLGVAGALYAYLNFQQIVWYYYRITHDVDFGLLLSMTRLFGVWQIGSTVLLVIGLLLGSCGFLGYQRTFGSVVSLVGLIVVLVLGWWVLIGQIIAVLGIHIPISHPVIPWMSLDLLLTYLGFFFVGVILLIWSVITILMRSHTRRPRLSIVAASLFIVAAIGYLLQILTVLVIYSNNPLFGVAGVLLFVAGIVNATVFFTMPTNRV